jgi:hypothetical protein
LQGQIDWHALGHNYPVRCPPLSPERARDLLHAVSLGLLHVTAKNDPSLFTVHSNIPKIPNIRTPFLQHMKHLIATFENHLLQYPKNPLATREKTTKKHTNNKEDGFEV